MKFLLQTIILLISFHCTSSLSPRRLSSQFQQQKEEARLHVFYSTNSVCIQVNAAVNLTEFKTRVLNAFSWAYGDNLLPKKVIRGFGVVNELGSIVESENDWKYFRNKISTFRVLSCDLSEARMILVFIGEKFPSEVKSVVVVKDNQRKCLTLTAHMNYTQFESYVRRELSIPTSTPIIMKAHNNLHNISNQTQFERFLHDLTTQGLDTCDSQDAVVDVMSTQEEEEKIRHAVNLAMLIALCACLILMMGCFVWQYICRENIKKLCMRRQGIDTIDDDSIDMDGYGNGTKHDDMDYDMSSGREMGSYDVVDRKNDEDSL